MKKHNIVWLVLILLGVACTVQAQVQPVPENAVLAEHQRYYVASVYDVDYLPYTLPTEMASAATTPADGTAEAVVIDIPGVIPTTGVVVSIPIIATGNGSVAGYCTTVKIPASLTEDGIGGDLMFSWQAQGYTSSTKSIIATIAAVDKPLNIKKMDINAGIGNDGLGVLLATFVYPYNAAGERTSFQVRAIAGIPDKMYGASDKTGSATAHQFLYLPVLAEDGRVWLNNNLGADYANLTSPHFNLAQQATAYSDCKAYGSQFQWGRQPDGHELVSWASSTSGSSLYEPSNEALKVATSEWRASQSNNLWSISSVNNPCPTGFRVPTDAEYTALGAAAGITDVTTAVASHLKLTAAGYRYCHNGFGRVSLRGYYWTQLADGESASFSSFSDTSNEVSTTRLGYGLSVRCIKN